MRFADDDRDLQRLGDIVRFAQGVASAVARGREAYDGDDETRALLHHFLIMLGEATAALSDEFKGGYPDIEWSAPKAFRNRILHGYFDVKPDVVWRAATHEVPEYAVRVAQIIEETT